MIAPACQSRPRAWKLIRVGRRDDHMVEQRDLDGLQRVPDAVRHVDVGPGRFGIAARGVRVQGDNRAGLKLQAADADLPGIDRRVADGAFLEALVGNETIFSVEIQNPELLDLAVARQACGSIR